MKSKIAIQKKNHIFTSGKNMFHNIELTFPETGFENRFWGVKPELFLIETLQFSNSWIAFSMISK